MKLVSALLVAAAFLGAFDGAVRAADSFPVHIEVDAGESPGDVNPFWRFFGADEPNYATMTNGEKLLGELGTVDSNHVYFRAHNLLTSGDGTPALKWGSTGAYTEDTNGNPVYNWTILDGIFDTYLRHGIRPYAQIGFMPRELSVHPEPYQHHWAPGNAYNNIFTGWAYPPKDYEKWRELVYQWVGHCVEKYGRAEVESWYWEVWNEPNIGYWQGTPGEFLKLHDYAIDGVKRALPTARVGGPDVAGSGGQFMRNFIEHSLRGTNYATGKIGTPLDFLSFHAKGAPVYTNGHVRMGIAAQLNTLHDGFRIASSFPELAGRPIIIGESDPDGCAACSDEQYPQYGYRNGILYACYTAEAFARTHELAARDGVNLEGAITWAFEFEGTPLFSGFRDLATGGIDKPVLNVFRMFGHMSGRWLATHSDCSLALDDIMRRGIRAEPDISALASLDQNKLCVMVWHYHDDDLPGAAASVDLTLDHLPITKGKANLEHFRIDEDHSNAFAAWQHMGVPQSPSAEQYAALEKSGQLAALAEPSTVTVDDGKVTLHFTLPRQAVSLLVLTW
jgi:xylan 1,4-beta-xylosidase